MSKSLLPDASFQTAPPCSAMSRDRTAWPSFRPPESVSASSSRRDMWAVASSTIRPSSRAKEAVEKKPIIRAT